jgi:rubrerythrin
MLESTRMTLVEISNIGFNMGQSIECRDPQEQFKRVQRMAESALAEERQHEKELLASLNNPEDA